MLFLFHLHRREKDQVTAAVDLIPLRSVTIYYPQKENYPIISKVYFSNESNDHSSKFNQLQYKYNTRLIILQADNIALNIQFTWIKVTLLDEQLQPSSEKKMKLTYHFYDIGSKFHSHHMTPSDQQHHTTNLP